MAGEIEIVFLMADLSGYTALTEAHGAVEAARTVTRYLEMARAVLQPGARLVEQVGDEVLIVSEAPEAAVRTALALRDAVEREPLFPALRAGLHAGPVIEQGGRYFGAALNLTARVPPTPGRGRSCAPAPWPKGWAASRTSRAAPTSRSGSRTSPRRSRCTRSRPPDPRGPTAISTLSAACRSRPGGPRPGSSSRAGGTPSALWRACGPSPQPPRPTRAPERRGSGTPVRSRRRSGDRIRGLKWSVWPHNLGHTIGSGVRGIRGRTVPCSATR